MNMHVDYPKKYPRALWDNVNVDYPVKISKNANASSETIARKWKTSPEVIHEPTRSHIEDLRCYSRDYRIINELQRSQTSLDYNYKIPETNILCKPTSAFENSYIYPPTRHIENRPPASRVHGTTEMKESFKTPANSSRLITNALQDNLPALDSLSIPIEPSWQKKLGPIDTTYEGYEKYLDLYLTTSRLHHRPFTADQLPISNTKDIVTYHTLSDLPWVRSPKPKSDEWFLRHRPPRIMCDREKFKNSFREIRTHNRLQWVPGSFRTEAKDNYGVINPLSNVPMDTYEEDICSKYQRALAKLKTNTPFEDQYIQMNYKPESLSIGSKKPICSVFEQCIQKK